MQKNKAMFRAMREACGITQAEVADEFDVRILSVKRWEKPDEKNDLPDDVWKWMFNCYNDMMARSLALADTIEAGHKDKSPVKLPYFRTQDDLDEVQLPLGEDQPLGYYNATVRQILCWLLWRGIDASVAYNGDGNNVIPFDDLVLNKML